MGSAERLAKFGLPGRLVSADHKKRPHAAVLFFFGAQGGYELDDIDRVAFGRRVRFMIEGERDDDLKIELELDEDGAVLERAEDLKEWDLPTSVKQSLKALTPGGDTREVSKLTTPRSIVFRVEVDFNDNDVVLILSETGALISRRQ